MLGEHVAFGAPLARHTSLRVGGPADALARPGSRTELRELLALCAAHGLTVHVLGQGFNTLARDGGVRGVVLQLGRLRELRVEPDGAVYAEAGVTHSALTRACAQAGRAGLEFGVGIPGSLGGWIRMNAGTRERELRDVALRVELAAPDGSPREVAAAELRWHYRQLELPPGTLVLGAWLHTQPAQSEQIRETAAAHMARRRATQPVNQPSCGSVFKNPPGDHAGRLIEAAGLKGARAGGAEISPLHANFIVTRSGARAAHVLELIERARGEVHGRFGITLETEVQIVGEDPS